jgi:hypothetical protein
VTYGRTKRSFIAWKLFASEDYERGLILTEGSIKPHVGGFERSLGELSL